MKASASKFHTMLRTAGRSTALAVTLTWLTGCAAHQPLRFSPKNVSRIQYNPRNCTQMPDGKFLCKDVVFTVAAVNVAPPAR
jgi:hypothetical protein